MKKEVVGRVLWEIFQEFKEYAKNKKLFKRLLNALTEEWHEYATKKGLGEEEIRTAIRSILETAGDNCYVELCHFPEKALQYFTPSTYETYLRIKELGLDKTGVVKFCLPDSWEELIDMVESGYSIDEIEMIIGMEDTEECKIVFWEDDELKIFPWEDDGESFFGDIILDVPFELKKEHGIDLFKAYDLLHEKEDEIKKLLLRTSGVKKVEWGSTKVLYCKKEDVPRVKEKVKEFILSWLK